MPHITFTVSLTDIPRRVTRTEFAGSLTHKPKSPEMKRELLASPTPSFESGTNHDKVLWMAVKLDTNLGIVDGKLNHNTSGRGIPPDEHPCGRPWQFINAAEHAEGGCFPLSDV